MALTADVKKEAEAIMASADVANMKVQKLNALWLQHGLASHQKHTPDRFLIHPMNRGGAMINGHDMVAKGERLLAQGLRKDLLECSAVAFAMSSSASERDSQVLANKNPFGAVQHHHAAANRQGAVPHSGLLAHDDVPQEPGQDRWPYEHQLQPASRPPFA